MAVTGALQLLALSAALSDRAPVVPSVACSSRWMRRFHMTLAGVAEDYVLQLPAERPSQV